MTARDDSRALEAAASSVDVRALQNACAAVDAGMLAVYGPDAHLTFTTALAVATSDATASWGRRADSSPGELDIHLAEPDGARWTVAGVEEKILGPARVRPLDRAHIVIRDAHAMSQVAQDKLLKAVEEPRGDVLFWFCVPSLEELPATLRSRAQRALQVRPAQPQAQWDYLIANGVSPSDVDAVMRAAAGDTRLVVCAKDERVRAALLHLSTLHDAVVTGRCTTPTALAFEATIDLCVLAKAVTGVAARTTPTDARSAWESLTPTAKTEARHLLQATIARCARDLCANAGAASGAEEMHALEITLRSCSRASAECAANTHPVTVLAALLSRVVLR